MHALLTEPNVQVTASYQRFVQRAQIEGMFPDGLVRGEPYLALNAVVLNAEDLVLLRWLTRVFSAALERAARQLAQDVPALIELGFPWVAAELLAAERPRTPILGRFDFACDAWGHWWLLEFNADTPSGVREAITVDRLVWQSLGSPAGLARPNRGLGRALVAAFRKAVAPLAAGGVLGLVTTVSELEDLAQMAFTAALLRPVLELQGIEVVLGDVDNLRGTSRGLELLGRRIDALYRYVPFEGIFGSPTFVAITEAGALGRPLLLNGLFGLLLQNKGLLAWVWQHQDDRIFHPEERAAIREHLPPTWMIADAPEPTAERSLVAKQVFGREGEEIFFSEDVSTLDWAEIRRFQTYIAQQRVDVGQLVAALPTAVSQEAQEVRASVGAFAADGKWAGFYSRLGGKVITSRAKWVATFVEGRVKSYE